MAAVPAVVVEGGGIRTQRMKNTAAAENKDERDTAEEDEVDSNHNREEDRNEDVGIDDSVDKDVAADVVDVVDDEDGGPIS